MAEVLSSNLSGPIFLFFVWCTGYNPDRCRIIQNPDAAGPENRISGIYSPPIAGGSGPVFPDRHSGNDLAGGVEGQTYIGIKGTVNLTHMKSTYLLIGCICLLAWAVMPAQAFTAKALTINLDANGNAQVDFQYDLSFAEQAAVFVNIANPSAELKTALENNLNRQVTVVKADSSSADVIIPSFATISLSNGTETMTTPAFSFANAQAAIRQYLVGRAHLGRHVTRCDDHYVPGWVPGNV